MQRTEPVMLMIVDGWGKRAPVEGIAVSLTVKYRMGRLLAEYPKSHCQMPGISVVGADFAERFNPIDREPLYGSRTNNHHWEVTLENLKEACND